MSRSSRAILSLLSRAAAAVGREQSGSKQQQLAALSPSSSMRAASPLSSSTSPLLLQPQQQLLRRNAYGSSFAFPAPSTSRSSSTLGTGSRREPSSAVFASQQLRWQSSSPSSRSSSNRNGAAAAEATGEQESGASASSSSASEDGERVVPEGEGREGKGERPSTPEELRAALDESEALLSASEQTATELRDRLARAVADMENLRERTARQAESARAFAVQSLVKNLLDVADNLSRAREAASDGGASASSRSPTAEERLASLVEGVQLTEKVLLSAFRSAGVESFGGEGDAFDPNEMEAMFEVPTASAATGVERSERPEPGHVAVVTKKGYKLNGRVVRPAQVGVFK